MPHNEHKKTLKLQHLEGDAFYSERHVEKDINCFPILEPASGGKERRQFMVIKNNFSNGKTAIKVVFMPVWRRRVG